MRIAQLIALLLSVSVVTTPQFAIPQTLEELIEQGKAGLMQVFFYQGKRGKIYISELVALGI